MKARTRFAMLLVTPKWHVVMAFALVFVPLAWYAMFSVRVTWMVPVLYGGGRLERLGWPGGFLSRHVEPNQEGHSYLFRNLSEFSAPMLLGNLGLAFLVGATVAMLWHVRTITIGHARPWQFSIRELLGATAVLAVLLSLWRASEVQYEREERVSAELESIGWIVHRRIVPIVPDWLMRPWIDLHLGVPRSFRRTVAIAWDAQGREYDKASVDNSRWGNVDDMLQDVAPKFKLLKHCEMIEVYDSGLTDIGVQAICSNLTDCLDASFEGCGNLTDAGLLCIVSHWPEIEALRLYHTGIHDEGIAHLRRLSKLSSLELLGVDQLSMDAACQVAELPSLRSIKVPTNWLHNPRFNEIIDRRDIGIGLLTAEEDDEDQH